MCISWWGKKINGKIENYALKKKTLKKQEAHKKQLSEHWHEKRNEEALDKRLGKGQK